MKDSDLHIQLVLDKSGSMEGQQARVVSGINELLDDQRKQSKVLEARTTVGMIQFDYSSRTIWAPSDIREVKPLTLSDYQPSGGTALYDGVAQGIIDVLTMKERAKKVLFVIQTDGEENSSKIWTEVILAPLIMATREAGWAFLFLGADQGAWTQAARMGISAGSTVNYTNTANWTARGMKGVYSAASASATSFRSGTVTADTLGRGFEASVTDVVSPSETKVVDVTTPSTNFISPRTILAQTSSSEKV